MAQFPQKLFVKVEGDSGTSYFVAAGDPLYLTKTGELVKLGVYQLVELGEARGAMNYRCTHKAERPARQRK